MLYPAIRAVLGDATADACIAEHTAAKAMLAQVGVPVWVRAPTCKGWMCRTATACSLQPVDSRRVGGEA